MASFPGTRLMLVNDHLAVDPFRPRQALPEESNDPLYCFCLGCRPGKMPLRIYIRGLQFQRLGIHKVRRQSETHPTHNIIYFRIDETPTLFIMRLVWHCASCLEAEMRAQIARGSSSSEESDSDSDALTSSQGQGSAAGHANDGDVDFAD